jgi:hypothetical protein
MSFLMPPSPFRAVIQSAGFDIEVWNDKTDLARAAFSQVTEPTGEQNLPPLGVHLLVGSDIRTKAYNLHRNLEDERVSLIETVAVKPNC